MVINMEIKEFNEHDIDIVFAIQQAAYKPLYEKYQDDDSNPYMESKETVLRKYLRQGTTGYLFVKDGVAVGCVRISIDTEKKIGRVLALAVEPRFQGQGIAQHALLEIEKIHSNVERWLLDTILQEEGNCHLYEKLGYKKTGELEEINEKMTLVFYQKGE